MTVQLRLRNSIALLLVTLLLPNLASAGVNTNISFLNPRFQVFIVGDVLNPGALEGGGEISMDDFVDFISISINATPDIIDQKVYLHFWEDLGDTRLIDYWSVKDEDRAFTIEDWVTNSSNGNGTYWNSELSSIESSGWYNRDYNASGFAEVNDVLALLENGIFAASQFTIGLDVYDLNDNLLSHNTQVIRVYNPSNPTLLGPSDGDEIDNPMLVPLRWRWDNGGQSLAADWTLIVVDAGETQAGDAESVILNRTGANTRFEGNPTSPLSHSYTGSGIGEDALMEGHWHYWQLFVNAPTMIDAGIKEYKSPVWSFYVPEPQEPDPQQIPGYNHVLYQNFNDGGDLNALIQDYQNQLQGFVPVSMERDQGNLNLNQIIQDLEDKLRTDPNSVDIRLEN